MWKIQYVVDIYSKTPIAGMRQVLVVARVVIRQGIEPRTVSLEG